MPRQIVHGALSVLTLVVASSAWAAPAPWVPNTTGNVGPAPTTFNKWEGHRGPGCIRRQLRQRFTLSLLRQPHHHDG